jgi:hypothetical protein
MKNNRDITIEAMNQIEKEKNKIEVLGLDYNFGNFSFLFNQQANSKHVFDDLITIKNEK